MRQSRESEPGVRISDNDVSSLMLYIDVQIPTIDLAIELAPVSAVIGFDDDSRTWLLVCIQSSDHNSSVLLVFEEL